VCAAYYSTEIYWKKGIAYTHTGTYDFLVLLLFFVYELRVLCAVCRVRVRVFRRFAVHCDNIFLVRSPYRGRIELLYISFSPFVASVCRRRYPGIGYSSERCVVTFCRPNLVSRFSPAVCRRRRRSFPVSEPPPPRTRSANERAMSDAGADTDVHGCSGHVEW